MSGQDNASVLVTEPSEMAPVVVKAGSLGAMPDPMILEKYEQILPGSAERIIYMTEQQMNHRHKTEQDIVRANIEAQRRGQWMAFTLGAVVLGLGGWLSYLGQNVGAAGAFLAAAATFIGVFFIGSQRREQEQEMKRRDGIAQLGHSS